MSLPEQFLQRSAQGDPPEVFAARLERNFDALDRLLAAAASVPTGTVLATARSSSPIGYLLCDGSAVSRTTYASLFDAIGTTYGTGDGSTTFNVPDLRGRVPVGVDGSAGRLSSNDALGNSSGSATHTLTTAEMPAHTHPPADTYESFWQRDSAGPNVIAGGGTYQANNVIAATGSAGGGGAHNNLQPYQVVNYIVKT